MIKRRLRVEGSDFDRGLKIGKELAFQIETNISSQKRNHEDTFESFEQWVKYSDQYMEETKKWAPKVYDELLGMAKGSGLGIDEITYLYTIYERSFLTDMDSSKCTSFVAKGKATTNGSVILGQTNDERLDQYRSEMDSVIHHVDTKTGIESMIYTHPGIPAYMGMNNYGLAIMWTFIDNGETQIGLPTAAIIRELLNKKTFEEAYSFIHEIPHAVPNQFTIAHASEGVVNIECFPSKNYDSPENDVLIHANHNSITTSEPEKGGSTTSCKRFEGMEESVASFYGNINAETGKEILANHINFPKSVCNHPSPEHPLSKTLASLLFDLGEGQMYVAFGNACQEPFYQFEFEMWLPRG